MNVMEQDIDAMLARLRHSPGYADLDDMEDRVLLAIHDRQRSVAGARLTIAAAASALILGVASTSLPSGRAQAAATIPLGHPGPLAPSSLLLGSAP